MTQTIVFIHGAWVTPQCWASFRSFFSEQGYDCLAPAWPGKDRPIKAIRADPSPLASVLFTWRGRRKVVTWSYGNFRYAFVHRLPEDEARAAYATLVTPETGRVFFQGAFSGFARHSPATVNYQNHARSPLLILAGADDRIVPASLVRRNHRKYAKSSAVTDFREFPGRTHWIIAQQGWQEVADFAHEWIKGQAPRAA